MYRPFWRRPVWRNIALGLCVAALALVSVSDLVEAMQGHYPRPIWRLASTIALTVSLGVIFTQAVHREGLWLPSKP
jgi:hypothetical protein